jgi:hypothetical protein
VPREKTTIYVDRDVLRATRAAAARTGRSVSDVVETALRDFLGMSLIQRVQEKADLGEEEAMKLAYQELHAMRRSRGQRTGQ